MDKIKEFLKVCKGKEAIKEVLLVGRYQWFVLKDANSKIMNNMSKSVLLQENVTWNRTGTELSRRIIMWRMIPWPRMFPVSARMKKVLKAMIEGKARKDELNKNLIKDSGDFKL